MSIIEEYSKEKKIVMHKKVDDYRYLTDLKKVLGQDQNTILRIALFQLWDRECNKKADGR